MRLYAVGIPMATTKVDGEEAPLFDALAHGRRRRIIAYVADRDRETTLEAIADHLRNGSGESQTRIQVSLHHRHLPKLDDLGILDYDDRANAVRPLPLAERAKELLSLCRPPDGGRE